jgi:hypothetical protein
MEIHPLVEFPEGCEVSYSYRSELEKVLVNICNATGRMLALP